MAYFRYIGLISYFVFGALAKETVEVNRDISVKPTPNPLTNAADNVNVKLSCAGSRPDLSYYIHHMVSWTFISSSGKKLPLSSGFYFNESASHLFTGPEARFKLSYGAANEGYVFNISIAGVIRADNGIYRCSLHDSKRQLIDSKDVRLTVVNPVEALTIELHDAQQTLVAKSSSPIIQNTSPFYITSGNYMIKCIASGSNPEPVMSLLLNELKQYVSVNVEEDNSTVFKSYVGAFEVKNLTISSHNVPQALLCTANIAGNFYDSQKTGILLIVPIEKPSFLCENSTVSLADRNCQVKCYVTDENQTNVLMCDRIGWVLGTTGQHIGHVHRLTDPNQKYKTIESKCEKTEQGLTVILDIFEVNSQLFQETFFVEYETGQNSYNHSVKIYDVTSDHSTTPHPMASEDPNKAAAIFTQMTLLPCFIVAALFKILAHLHLFCV